MFIRFADMDLYGMAQIKSFIHSSLRWAVTD